MSLELEREEAFKAYLEFSKGHYITWRDLWDAACEWQKKVDEREVGDVERYEHSNP